MSSDPQPLSFEILDRFRTGLRHAGAPLAEELEPGLSDGQIDRLVRELGVAAPPELRTLWGWSSAPSVPGGSASWEINSEYDLWPPRRAIEETKSYRLDKTVSRSTIAFAGPTGDGFLLVEGTSGQPTSRVIYADIEDPETIRAAPSLGALFQLWADQLSNGDYRFDGARWLPEDGPSHLISDES